MLLTTISIDNIRILFIISIIYLNNNMQSFPKIAKYEKSDIFNQASFSSLDLACDIALEIDVNVISSKLFHFSYIV